MKAEPSPAIPNLMALLCQMGGAMREARMMQLWMQMLLIGALVPEVGWLIGAWLDAEERVAAGQFWVGGEPAEPGENEPTHELRSGWVRQDGRVWLWRHVGKICVVIIPVRFVGSYSIKKLIRSWRKVAPNSGSPRLSQILNELPVWPTMENCVLIVPNS